VGTIDQLEARSAELDGLPTWQQLRDEANRLAAGSLASMLDDPARFEQFSIEAPGLALDYSRNLLSNQARQLLIELADSRELSAWRDALFSGQCVNSTEARPALHMALRAQADADFQVDGQQIMQAVLHERERMLSLATEIRTGAFIGHSGAQITDVVNIGIGGSDLGLVMVSEALQPYLAQGIRLHFVSNVDGSELADVLSVVEPAQTLFIVCSKSFTTLETQLNASAARAWFLDKMPREAVARHFVAVSVNSAAMDSFGISPALRFPIWDWVGGRYSLWSSVGLAVAIGIGRDAFGELLAGAAEMDRHFCSAPWRDNVPVMLALIGVWNRNFLGLDSHAVLPYSARLGRLPAYLQQLEMESNGKSVTRDGKAVNWSTAPVIWGEPGSNAQHSFFQLLHQGTVKASADVVLPATAGMDAEHRVQNQANAMAQAEAFARGYKADAALAGLRARGLSETDAHRLVPHKLHPGGVSCNLLVLRDLTPRTLGRLIALYEHKVFVQGVIWGVNSFDQWGVELGKQMAGSVAVRISQDDRSRLPGIAARLLEWSGDD